jgi:PAS domain S-box-containing protein
MSDVSYNALLRDLHSADAALATVHDAVIQTGHGGEIVRMNRAAERMTGMPLNKLLGHPVGDALSLTDAPDEDRTVRRGQPMPQGVYQVLRQRGGGERLVLVSMADHAHGRTYVLRDAANDRQPRSGHDSLTGLPDRQFLEQRLSEILASAHAPRHQLLYLDLDQFNVEDGRVEERRQRGERGDRQCQPLVSIETSGVERWG